MEVHGIIRSRGMLFLSDGLPHNAALRISPSSGSKKALQLATFNIPLPLQVYVFKDNIEESRLDTLYF